MKTKNTINICIKLLTTLLKADTNKAKINRIRLTIYELLLDLETQGDYE